MTQPIELVNKLAVCGRGYGLAAIRDEDGDSRQAIIDLNGTDDTPEPRALILDDHGHVASVVAVDRAFVDAYMVAEEKAPDQRNIFCYDIDHRIAGEPPSSISPQSSSFRGLSFTPRLAFGFITDASLLDFNSSFPHEITRLVGAEITIDWDKRILGSPAGRSGELAIMYYWGHASENFNEGDLPLSDDPILPELQEQFPDFFGDDPLTASDIVSFSSQREANSHWLAVEWRWPSNAPVWQDAHWSIIHPRFSVGAGVAYYNTRLIRNAGESDAEFETTHTVHVFGTGATMLDLLEFRTDHSEMALGGGVRIYAGMLFGYTVESGLRFTWHQ